MRKRVLAIIVLALAVVILALVDRSSPAAPVVSSVHPVGPETPRAGAVGSTWYCAAAGAATSSAPTHELILANPTGAAVSAQVTAVAAKIDPPTTVAVGARASVVVPASVVGASYLVEFSRPGPVVSHRLSTGSLMGESPCATAGTDRAYFATAATQVTQGSDAQLWLFNPFPSDASLDVAAVTADGVRTPGALSGVVVPGGTTKMIDLGKIVQRRDQFSLSLVTRSGLIVAELAQTSGTPAGLELIPGVARTATRLVFADGESGEGLGERYVVFNPTSRDASVLLSVVPYDAAVSELPEPFELDIPARKFVTTDMEHQTRVIQGQPHWVRLESTNGVGVVAQRLTVVTATGNPFGLKSGAAISLGQSVSSRRWVTPWADSAEATSSIVIANPSVGTIAEARVTPFGAGKNATGSNVIKAEVGPGHSAVIDLGASGADPRGLVVTASSPVVVERRIFAAGGGDLAVVPAVPVGPLVALPPMSNATGSGG